MRPINKLWILAISTFVVMSCNKVDDLPLYQNATAPLLNASTATIATLPADSNKTALTLTWTYPNHATSDPNSVKYIVEMDTTGRGFAKGYAKIVTGSLGTSFTGKELNNMLLGYGYPFNIPVDMDVRVTSSYANNNERISSNTLKIRMTPYKVPPKVALPASGRLFIVGDATDFGWTNDAAPPFPANREFTRLSETQWAGVFNLKGSGAYKFLQKQGEWSSQFHMITGGTAAEGSFEQKDADPAFPAPSAAGAYKIVVDFQAGKYMVTKVDNPLPANLYIIGDATPSDWTNTPPDTQKLTGLTNGVFELAMAFTPGGYYKFISSLGNWQPQFGGKSATGGELNANYGGGSDPDAIPAPSTAGNYKIQVNFITGAYTVTKQ